MVGLLPLMTTAMMAADQGVQMWPAGNGAAAPLTLLPLSTNARCLDGTPYGFYFVPSHTNSTKWTISIEGGGWCYDEVSCLSRAGTRLGSSKLFPNASGCGCMNPTPSGAEDCNCIYMPYGDGASFSGFRENPWPVPGHPGKELYFRGIRNLEATLEHALAHLGFQHATELTLTGGSAGGLSTFLHADAVAAFAARHAPNCKKVRAAPVVGFFLDHPPFQPDPSNYTAEMAYVTKMQNVTGALSSACLAANPQHPGYCFMSPHMQEYIKTPFYVFNSKVDEWQMDNVLRVPCYKRNQHPCTAAEQEAIISFGEAFLHNFRPVQLEPKNGGFITSCVCHGCPWNTLVLNGKNALQHYADWYNGAATGAAAFQIDDRKPNGGGAITDKACAPFP